MSVNLYVKKSYIYRKLILSFLVILVVSGAISLIGYPVVWNFVFLVVGFSLLSYAAFLQNSKPVISLSDSKVVINDVFSGKVGLELDLEKIMDVGIEGKSIIIISDQEKYCLKTSSVKGEELEKLISMIKKR